MSRMGRPPLPEGEVRATFTIRLNSSELDEIEEAAKRAGAPKTKWAREVLLAAARER